MSLDESRQIRSAIESVVRDVIEQETRSCFRVYKGVIVDTPTQSDDRYKVRLVGYPDDNAFYASYTTACADLSVDDIVWVGVLFNNFKNAVVWERVDFVAPSSSSTTAITGLSFGVSGNGVNYNSQTKTITIEFSGSGVRRPNIIISYVLANGMLCYANPADFTFSVTGTETIQVTTTSDIPRIYFSVYPNDSDKISQLKISLMNDGVELVSDTIYFAYSTII